MNKFMQQYPTIENLHIILYTIRIIETTENTELNYLKHFSLQLKEPPLRKVQLQPNINLVKM